ncbi:hypothetical protein Cgig2_005032 [Carnegiea gigantea]|uniref:Uncharacterized protein n=1 Tax=Carnegiea gigantea TaxID=171969 RepID=A0A9Q1KXM1_9CARY|nr:hypothetical protein Cgig2_005032 [Carnegiea gigantea]
MYPNFTDCTTLLERLEIWAYQSMNEEQAHNRLPSSTSSSSHYEYDEIGRSVSSSSPVSSQLEETEALVQQQDQHQQRNTGPHPRHSLLPFSVSASVTLIIGFYGSFEVQLGPNCSYLIEANPIFVRSIEAEQIGVKTSGPMLYGFDKSLTPNVRTSWSQSHTASAAPYDRTGWAYFLNSVSEVEVYYEVKSPRFVAVPLIIAQGSESFHEWIQYPSDPNLVLSWKYIYGSGKISQEIEESDTYYVAVGNLDSDTVTVHLNISIKSVLYNTSDAYFQCPLRNYRCSFKLHHLRPNAAVLTSPGAGQVLQLLSIYGRHRLIVCFMEHSCSSLALKTCA